MRKKILFLFFCITLLVISGCAKKQIACTMEAKICLDGSAVSRNSDNNCEFNQCPKESKEYVEQVSDKSDASVVTTGNEDIRIFGIEAGDIIKSPVTINGEGVAFENTLIVELRNNDHAALVKEFVNIRSGEAGQTGAFLITFDFNFQNTKEGYIAVYEQSAKDGSEEHLVEIPVKFEVNDK